MRIVLLLPAAVPSLHPVSLYGVHLGEGLAAAGHDVRIFAPRRRGHTEIPPPTWWPPVLPVEALASNIARHPPDVVHTLGPVPPPSLGDASPRIVRTLFRPPPGPDAADADLHLTPSRQVAAAWRRVGRDLRVVPTGVRRLRGVPPDGRCGPLLWAGRVRPGTGLKTAIDAVRQARLPLRLLVEAEDSDYLDEVLRPRLGADLLLSTPRTPHALSDALRSAPALLHVPDAPAPCCMLALQALACGTPVVGANEGELGELLATPGAGRAVPPGHVDALAAALSQPPPAGREPWEAAGRFPLEAMTVAHLEAYTGS